MRIIVAFLLLAATVQAAEPKAHRGLAYAEPKDDRQTLDVYAPTDGKNLPVVVLRPRALNERLTAAVPSAA